MEPYKRKDSSVWWIGFRNAAGKWEYRSTGVKDERLAKRALEQIEAAIARKELIADRPLTVSEWEATWTKAREKTVWSSHQDSLKLTRHVLPVLGGRRLAEVTQDEIRALVQGWRDGGALAPRSIRNLFWIMGKMFTDAVTAKKIDRTPCVLIKGDRPVIRDADRRWRKTAVFGRGEAEQLVSDLRMPERERVLWGLGFFAGLRLGEISALRWRDYDMVREPLACLNVSSSYTRINGEEKGTKTENPREVPVHPELEELLQNWRRAGWEEFHGAEPKPNDLVLPNQALRHLTDNNVNAIRASNFELLEMRTRRFHDARRTFISLAQADGAQKDVLQVITHNPGEVMDLYTTFPWPTLCEAVLCLKLSRRPPLRGLPTPRTTLLPGGVPTLPSDSTTFSAQEGIRTRLQRHSSAALDHSPLEAGPVEAAQEAPSDGDRRNVGRIPDLPVRLRRLVAKYAAGGRR